MIYSRVQNTSKKKSCGFGILVKGWVVKQRISLANDDKSTQKGWLLASLFLLFRPNVKLPMGTFAGLDKE